MTGAPIPLALMWGLPTVLVLLYVGRRWGTPIALVGALVAGAIAALILAIVLRSDRSTAGIGLVAFSPLIWSAPLVVVAVRRWRTLPGDGSG